METAAAVQAPPSRAERYRQIMGVLAKHGIMAAGTNRSAVKAEHVREACEELGTTFIKMGQLLSTRADILPDEYRAELAKLQDSVPPLPVELIEAEIESELGAPPEELFASFDREPLASASIGQVHRATLEDGRDVVVKVRKPGVRQLVETDLDILTSLAASSRKYFPALNDYDIDGVVAEFVDMLRAELDYTREARNVERFASFFEDETGFNFPEVIWERSTAHVLTLTHVDGTRPEDVPKLTARKRETVAQRIARIVIEPAFLHGFFHADPHPGNVLVRSDGVVGMVDFGMMGRFTDETRRDLADLFQSLSRRDVQRFTDRVIDVAPPTQPIDRVALTQELGRLTERYMSASLERVQLGSAINDLLELVRRHGLRLPGNVAMFFKALVMSEGLISAIDPEKTIQDFIDPIAEKLEASRLEPDQWSQRLKYSAMDAAELSIELPRRADRVLADVERGNLRVWARIEDLEPALRRMERMVERVNMTLLASACIVGLAVLLIYYHPSGWRGAVGVAFWVAVVIAIGTVLRTAVQTIRKGG